LPGFGISRKTGYKIFNRYKADGLGALTDRSRGPVRYANQLPEPVEAMIVRCKQEKPHWGAQDPRTSRSPAGGDVRIPATSTVHAVLDRYGLVSQASQEKHANKAAGTARSSAAGPNDLWCTDFKGEFKLLQERSASRARQVAREVNFVPLHAEHIRLLSTLGEEDLITWVSQFDVFDRMRSFQSFLSAGRFTMPALSNRAG
jgi:transposase